MYPPAFPRCPPLEPTSSASQEASSEAFVSLAELGTQLADEPQDVRVVGRRGNEGESKIQVNGKIAQGRGYLR